MEITTERNLISGVVEVSFSLSYDDWCIIQQSEPWNKIQAYLETREKEGSQMSLKERVDLWERV